MKRKGGGAPREDLLALALFILITAVWFWRLLLNPLHLTPPSVTRDNIMNFWFLWWVKEACLHGHNVFQTQLLYYPWGTSLAFQEFSPIYGMLSLPLLAWWDSPGALILTHNFWVLGSFVLTGYTTFLFARRESGSTSGGILAGLIMSLSAFRFHHLEHINLLSTYWLPITAWIAGHWCFSTDGTRNSKWWLAGAGVCGLGLAATSLIYLMEVGLFLAGWIGLKIGLQKEHRRAPVLARFGIFGLAFVVGSLPIILPWMVGQSRGAAPMATPAELMRFGPDLVGFVLPERSLVLGPLTRSLGVPHHGPGGNEIYLGLVALGMSIVAVARDRRWALPFALTGVAAFLISWGPGLWIANRYHPLPFSSFNVLKSILPPLGALRTPERLIVVVLLVLAVLSARGLQRTAQARRGRILVGGILVMALVELFPHFERPKKVALSPVYTRIKEDPSPGAVLELPLKTLRVSDYMFYQTVHLRPLVNEPLSRPPSNTRSLVKELDLERRLALQGNAQDVFNDLRSRGVRFIICHRIGMPPEIWRWLPGEYQNAALYYYGDADLVAFKL